MRVVHRHGRPGRAVLTGLFVASSLAIAGAGIAVPASASAASQPTAAQLAALNNLIGSTWGNSDADKDAKDNKGKNSADLDVGSLATVTKTIGARDVWGTKDSSGQAITGRGVTVAVLDTGVNAKVAGLDGAGKVVAGPDLSMEANSPTLAGQDTYGHGTFLAGIIAARDAVTVDDKGRPKPTSDATQLGVAPDARVLALKMATADGSTDVSQVIAGLDWVVQHRNDNGMNVRVINLSFGTDSVQSYQLDPLAAAAENAWKQGIVVVVSGGNEGASATGLTDPATDPYVISVGASDSGGTVSGWNKPTVASFSQRGTTTRHVDLVAPGTSLVSLRAPSSNVDANHPEGLVSGDTTGRLFRGSGTSQAAAVVSGAVALLLQAYPNLSPDEIKAALVTSADPMSGSIVDKGAGELNVKGALVAAGAINSLPSAFRTLLVQNWLPATGLGSLEAARGGSNLSDPDTGAVLTGEVDVQGQPWNAATWRAASVAGTAWTAGTWNGATWTGGGWDNSAWVNSPWSGARWSGARWSAVSWDGARWSGARWSGARWSGARWSDASWG